MPNPKHRHSKTRTRKRRTHHALAAKNLVPCETCDELKLPHQVCPHCGNYKGELKLAVE